VIAGIRRSEVEIHHRYGVMKMVVTDLVRPHASQQRNPGKRAIKGIVFDVGEPMARLIGEEVDSHPEERVRELEISLEE
jgi:hypothetical protein